MMWNDFITELRKLFAQRKNYVVFGGLLLIIVLMMASLHSRDLTHYQDKIMWDAGTSLAKMLDGMYFSRLILLPMNLMVLPIFICTVAGDLVAGELQEGSLKLYAARPRSRFSILFCRILAMIVFTSIVCFVCSVISLLVGVVFYGWPDVQLILLKREIVGADFVILSAKQASERMVLNGIYRIFSLFALGSVTLFFSCIFKRMTTATVLGITIYFSCYFLELMPETGNIKPYLLTNVMNSDMYLWINEIPWQRVLYSFLHLLGYLFVFLGLSFVTFTYRDLA